MYFENLKNVDRNFTIVHRDLNLERDIITASRIELLLREALHSSEILKYIHGTYENGKLFSCHGHTLIAPDTGFFPYCPVAWVNKAAVIHSSSPHISVTEYPMGMVPLALNHHTSFITPFVLVRYISSLVSPRYCLSPTLLDSYDMDVVHQIAGEHGISISWGEAEQSKEGHWKRSSIVKQAREYINLDALEVRDYDGYYRYTLEFLTAPAYKSALSPVAFFQKSGGYAPMKLYFPPLNPVIIGAEYLKGNKKSVIISEEVGLTFANGIASENVYLALLGGHDAFANYDLHHLPGRDVSWLLHDFNDAGEYSMLQSAVTFCALAKKAGIRMRFTRFVGLRRGLFRSSQLEAITIEGFEEVAFNEVLTRAMAAGVHIPEVLEEVRTEIYTGDRLEMLEQPPYVIAPIIRKGSMTTIYGGSGCGKSQVAISICCALNAGKNVFGDIWQVQSGESLKSVTCAGEMSSSIYGERLRIFQEAYGATKEHKKNFVLARPTDLDLVEEDAYKKINKIIKDAVLYGGTPGKPVDLIVFDNLTTLSNGAEHALGYNKVNQLMNRLTDRGISIIIIHHENAMGDLRGARKMADVMDNVFHLFEGEKKSDELAILIKDEKRRSNTTSNTRTIKVVFDAKDGWKTAPLTARDREVAGEEKLPSESESREKQAPKVPKTVYRAKGWVMMTDDEKRQAIREERLRGLTNKQIGANHGCGRSTIAKFRKENNLLDSDLLGSAS